MNRKIVATIAGLLAVLMLIGCQAFAEAPEKEEQELVTIDGDVITVLDDGTGESGSKNGMEKQVVLTNRNIGYKGQTGPFAFEIQGIQISAIKATAKNVASLLGLEVDQEATLVAIQLSVENTSDEDMNFYPNQSTIITSDKEQVDAEIFLSDSVGGEFLGNVIKEGQIYWICKKTNADSLTGIRWRINGPSDDHLNRVGEDVSVEFVFPQD